MTTRSAAWTTAALLCLLGCSVDSSDVTSDAGQQELRVLMTLPDFELTDQANEAYGSDQLDGKIWIANFMFTRCPSTCPVQTANIAELQKTLSGTPEEQNIQLLSISVDPEYDTPSVLKEFSQLFRADDSRWHFLTGDREAIWNLCKQGFRMSVDDAPPDSASPILHSDRFVLVDRERRVRGLYSGTKREDQDRLVRDVRRLLSEDE